MQSDNIVEFVPKLKAQIIECSDDLKKMTEVHAEHDYDDEAATIIKSTMSQNGKAQFEYVGVSPDVPFMRIEALMRLHAAIRGELRAQCALFLPDFTKTLADFKTSEP